jgi:hypothetical protein
VLKTLNQLLLRPHNSKAVLFANTFLISLVSMRDLQQQLHSRHRLFYLY